MEVAGVRPTRTGGGVHNRFAGAITGGPEQNQCGDRGTAAHILDHAMTLLIVIVNYRTTELTLDCLRSLQDEVGTVAGTRVVVTDNASGDDSVAHLEAAVQRQRLGRLGDDSAPGAERRVRGREQRGDPPGPGVGRPATIRPAAQPRHDRPPRGGPGAGRVHGGPARRRHCGEPAGRARRHATALGVPVPDGPGRARGRTAARPGLAAPGALGVAPAVPAGPAGSTGWPGRA